MREAKEHSPSVRRLATRVFFLWPPAVFEGRDDLQLEVYEELREFLHLPLSAIRVVGSGHTGFSLVKGSDFVPGGSDLDLAIVDSGLFLELFEHAFDVSSGWKDASSFGSDVGARDRMRDFLKSLNRGVLRPDLLPASPKKAEWTNFFGSLSAKHSAFCNGISAFIYARESFLTAKQQSAIDIFFASEGIL